MAQPFTAAIKAEFDLKGHDFSHAANAPALGKREKRRATLMLDPESGRVEAKLDVQFERTAARHSEGLTHVRELSVLARFGRL